MLRPVADTSQINWLLQHSTSRPPTAKSHVSSAFPAYARVLNPANGFDGGPVRWSRMGREVAVEITAETQWSELAAVIPDDGELVNLDAPEWSPDPPLARALTSVLERHTEDPTRCYFLVWEGYAGAEDQFVGLGARTIAMSPIRSFLLLTGTLQDACEPFLEGDNRLPNRWWPAGREWCVGNEIYTRSVFVGGSEDCIAAVLAHPDLEAYPASADSPAWEEME